MRALVFLASVLIGLLAAPWEPAAACTKEEFAQAVDRAGEALRRLNADNAPRLQAKLRQLKDARRWPDSGFEERAFALLRFEAPDENEALRNAQQWLETNEHDLARAVLIHDGLVTWDGIRRDARGFAIHRPKLFAAVNLPEALEPIIRALYRGVDAHEQGSKSWSRHLDQSI